MPILCILKQPHPLFSHCCISAEVIWFLFELPTIFVAVVAEIFVSRPDHGLVSTEFLIFHSLIRAWTLLTLTLWTSSYVPFLFYKLQLPFPVELLTIRVLSPWLRLQKRQCKGQGHLCSFCCRYDVAGPVILICLFRAFRSAWRSISSIWGANAEANGSLYQQNHQKRPHLSPTLTPNP